MQSQAHTAMFNMHSGEKLRNQMKLSLRQIFCLYLGDFFCDVSKQVGPADVSHGLTSIQVN